MPSNCLKELRDSLLSLHGTLMRSEQASYEHTIARINSRGQLLDLVMNDPWFAWLHELSLFVVAIDEAMDADEPPTLVEADSFVARAKELLRPSEEGSGFGKSYFDAMQRDPDVILAHAQALKVIVRISGNDVQKQK